MRLSLAFKSAKGRSTTHSPSMDNIEDSPALDVDHKKVRLSSRPSTDSESDEEASGLLNRKVIILGDSQTGKTSLLIRFDQDKYCDAGLSATVGVGYANKVVDVDNGPKVKLQIWDTAGQERFRSITRAYYRDAEALLLVYDITNRKSFDNIKNWITEVCELAKPDVIMMLLGNKLDMEASREVSVEDGRRIAQENGAAFTEASAKSGDNVENAFLTLARQLHNKTTPAANNGTTKLLDNIRMHEAMAGRNLWHKPHFQPELETVNRNASSKDRYLWERKYNHHLRRMQTIQSRPVYRPKIVKRNYQQEEVRELEEEKAKKFYERTRLNMLPLGSRQTSPATSRQSSWHRPELHSTSRSVASGALNRFQPLKSKTNGKFIRRWSENDADQIDVASMRDLGLTPVESVLSYDYSQCNQ